MTRAEFIDMADDMRIAADIVDQHRDNKNASADAVRLLNVDESKRESVAEYVAYFQAGLPYETTD